MKFTRKYHRSLTLTNGHAATARNQIMGMKAMSDNDLIRRAVVLDILDLAEHDAEERDWRSGANEIAKLRRFLVAIPAATPTLAEVQAVPEVRALVEAARPFAYEIDAPVMADDRTISVRVTIGDNRRLRAALAPFTKGGGV